MAAIAHISPEIRSAGGMQHLIRRHVEWDRASGHRSRAVALFESEPWDDGIALGGGGGWTPRRVRREFQARGVPVTRGSLAIYHNAWGLPLLAPGDGASRRVAYLHTHWPGLDAALRASARWCDAFVGVSADLIASVRRAVPDYPADRLYRVEYPVELPDRLVSPGRASGPLRFGYVGRVESKQKRVERLPELMRAWTAQGGEPVEWQVLGDGSARRKLESDLRAWGPVRFHGWLEGDAYARALAALDVLVFTSDYEGTPIALLEALGAGAVPLFPAIAGDGADLARQVDARCVYPPGELAAAARQLQELLAGDRVALRARAQEVVAGRTPEKFRGMLTRLTDETLARPRRSASADERRSRWSDALPMAWVGRYQEAAIWR